MTQDETNGVHSKVAITTTPTTTTTLPCKMDKNGPPSKVVIRRMPPSMTLESFVDQISPVPENDYLHFVKADMSLGQYAFSRAYINFCLRDDIFVFKDKFDGYVFVDGKGVEYPAVVEFAPFPKVPKKKPKKVDSKCGTIEEDPDYLKFLDSLKNPEEVNLPSTEFYLEEIENRERELRANSGSRNFTTPLIEYLREKKAEKVRVREERREERKRREVDRKKQKEDERRRKKADRDRERERNNARDRMTRDGKQISKMAEPAVKLLRNPERERRKETDNEGSTLSVTENEVHAEATTSSIDSRAARRPDSGGPASARQRLSVSGVKESNSVELDRERNRRRDDNIRLRDNNRQRDRRPINRREHMDEQTAGEQFPHKFNAKTTTPDGSNSTETKPKTSCSSSRTSTSSTSGDWHRGAQRSGFVSSSGNFNFSGKPNQGKGKSYEKSRQESLVSKARSVDQQHGKGDRPVANKDYNNKDDDRKKRNMSTSDGCDQQVNRDRRDSGETADCDSEVAHSSFRRERYSRDPRTERRIKNKDRPSIELYRPGMRRMSQQWSGNQKESSSSSPSPTTVDAADNINIDDKETSKITVVTENQAITDDDHHN